MAQPGDVEVLLAKYIDNRGRSEFDAKASTRYEEEHLLSGEQRREGSVGGDRKTFAPVRAKLEKDIGSRDGDQENGVGEAHLGFVDKIVSLKELLPQNFKQTSLEGISEDTALFIRDLRSLLTAAGERMREYEQLERSRPQKYAKVEAQNDSRDHRDCGDIRISKSLLEGMLTQLLSNGSKETKHSLERLVSPPTEPDRDYLRTFLAGYQVGNKRQRHQDLLPKMIRKAVPRCTQICRLSTTVPGFV